MSRCLQSLPENCEVVVLDSGSTDRTEAIARSFGAKFFTRKFDAYDSQKNAAIDLATRPWILSIDADEALDDALRLSLIKVVTQGSTSDIDAFPVSRQLHFLGRRLAFGKTRDCPLRLFRRGTCKFAGSVHERLIAPPGRVGPVLKGSMDHFSYASVEDYFSKFNRYTTSIAEKHWATGKRPPSPPMHWLRPFFEFLSRYLLRLGFLDGRPGFTYALFSSLYVYVKYEKLIEKHQRAISRES